MFYVQVRSASLGPWSAVLEAGLEAWRCSSCRLNTLAGDASSDRRGDARTPGLDSSSTRNYSKNISKIFSIKRISIFRNKDLFLPFRSVASISSQWLDDLDELLEVSAGVLDWNVGERHLVGENCFLVDDNVF